MISLAYDVFVAHGVDNPGNLGSRKSMQAGTPALLFPSYYQEHPSRLRARLRGVS
uniref:Uncharacterized protein n=1 Tax=Candidatus Kentrum sp. LPFa TaxID=2126335 RepID=A0A450XD04_9GAMM|nr:MAG: hypothetical protein BECKLPF1236C_GA0070990_1004317 [Candidatus Kentron sp. LPFa]